MEALCAGGRTSLIDHGRIQMDGTGGSYVFRQCLHVEVLRTCRHSPSTKERSAKPYRRNRRSTCSTWLAPIPFGRRSKQEHLGPVNPSTTSSPLRERAHCPDPSSQDVADGLEVVDEGGRAEWVPLPRPAASGSHGAVRRRSLRRYHHGDCGSHVPPDDGTLLARTHGDEANGFGSVGERVDGNIPGRGGSLPATQFQDGQTEAVSEELRHNPRHNRPAFGLAFLICA